MNPLSRQNTSLDRHPVFVPLPGTLWMWEAEEGVHGLGGENSGQDQGPGWCGALGHRQKTEAGLRYLRLTCPLPGESGHSHLGGLPVPWHGPLAVTVTNLRSLRGGRWWQEEAFPAPIKGLGSSSLGPRVLRGSKQCLAELRSCQWEARPAGPFREASYRTVYGPGNLIQN